MTTSVQNPGTRPEVGKCQARTRQGKPCANRAMPGSGWCVFHDPTPEGEARRRENSRRGGQRRSNSSRVRRQLASDVLQLDEVAGLLSVALKSVVVGKMPPSIATAASNVARALIDVREADDLERRLTALEAASEQRKGRRS